MIKPEDVVRVHDFNVLFLKSAYKDFQDNEEITNCAIVCEHNRNRVIELLKSPLGKQFLKIDMKENINKIILLELKKKGLKNIPKNRKIILNEKPELNCDEDDLPFMLHSIHTNIINKKDKYENRLEQQLVKNNFISDEDDYMEEEEREKRKKTLSDLVESPIYLYLEDQLESYLMPYMTWTNLFLAMSIYPDDVWSIYKNQYYSVVVNNWSQKPYKVFDLLYYYNYSEKLDRGGTKAFMLATNYKQFEKIFNERVEKDSTIKPKNYEIIFK